MGTGVKSCPFFDLKSKTWGKICLSEYNLGRYLNKCWKPGFQKYPRKYPIFGIFNQILELILHF
jgi:hypothetical protein